MLEDRSIIEEKLEQLLTNPDVDAKLIKSIMYESFRGHRSTALYVWRFNLKQLRTLEELKRIDGLKIQTWNSIFRKLVGFNW